MNSCSNTSCNPRWAHTKDCITGIWCFLLLVTHSWSRSIFLHTKQKSEYFFFEQEKIDFFFQISSKCFVENCIVGLTHLSDHLFSIKCVDIFFFSEKNPYTPSPHNSWMTFPWGQIINLHCVCVFLCLFLAKIISVKKPTMNVTIFIISFSFLFFGNISQECNFSPFTPLKLR
jgi:hypothetical protein